MRNLVIDELMEMITDGVEIFTPTGTVITDRKALESLSNRELLDALIEAVEFQG
jgi:hypothetical protein